MADFFRNQLDFIFFCYGLSFILLVPITHFLNRRPQRRLHWGCLGLFGAAHGLNEWLGLLALDLGSGLIFDLTRLFLLTVSYLFLVEFGRAGTLTVRGRGPGRWVLAALLGVALLGGLAGIPGLFATSRYALGLAGGLWAAGALFLIAKPYGPGQLFLRGAALGMGAYALTSGLVVNPAPFFPASWLNSTSFLAATGLPIQLVRGLLAFWIATCLALFGHACLVQETDRRIRVWSRSLIFGAAAILLSLLITGWLITQYLGENAAQEMRTHQEGHAKSLFRALQDRIQETDRIASVLAISPWIAPALENGSVQTIEQANLILDRYCMIFPKAICYLMDRDGLIIASSKHHQADSFVGKSYKFRPYFQQAMQGTAGRYWAIGMITDELGYFASYPVRGHAGQIVGVAVFKRPIDEREELFQPQSAGFVIDSQGIVILANQPEMGLKSLWPLSPATREQLRASRQFGPGPFTPILTREPADRAEVWFEGQRQLILRQPLPWEGWSTVILNPLRPIILARLLGITLTLLLCLGVIGFLTVIGLTIEATARIQNSERRYRGLYESLRDGSVAVNLEGKIIEYNPEFQDMLGYTGAEIHQLTYRDITPEQWHPVETRIIEEQVFPRGYSDLFEKEYRRKDGTVFPVELQIYLIRDNQGHPTGMWGLVRDITERKQAKEARRAATEALQALIQASPLAIFVLNPEGRVQLWNEAAKDIFGWTAEEAVGQVLPIVPEEKMPEFRGFLQRALDGESLAAVEARRRKKDGTPIDTKVYTSTLYDPQGQVSGVMAVVADNTLQKQAEDTLRASEERYRTVADYTYDMEYWADPNGKILYMSPACERLTGYPPQAFRENPQLLFQILHPEDNARFVNHVKEVRFLKEPSSLDFRLIHRDGKEFWVNHTCLPVFGADKQPLGRRASNRDITERKQAEAAFQALVAHAPLGIYIVQNGKFVMINPGFEAIIGYRAQELLGKDSLCLVTPLDQEMVREKTIQQLKEVKFPPCEFQVTSKSGETLRVMGIVASTQYEGKEATLGYFMDITPLKKLEAQFLQSQKMEAVGRLAGGVAHDFNNMLGAIIGYAEMLMMRLSKDEQLCRYTEGIKKAADRASSLTRQLLAFSRKQVLQVQALNLNEIITDLENMLHRLLGEDIEMVTVFDPALGSVNADKGLIEQVILNLAVNARDAMPQGGKLTIEAREVYLDETYCREHPYVSPGLFVMLAVSDDGIGMDADTRSRIFEPFFTTKEVGKGTGLGLSTVYGIIKQIEGSIEVYSEPGLGTTFKIYLPRVEKPADRPQAEIHAAALHGNETILVVEDDDLLRPLVIDVLKMYGYEALEARDGDEALCICEDHAGPIHLMLTDVIMPGMGGRQLAEQVAARRPQMKVLFMSGYTDNAIVHHGILHEGISFIQKPFAPEDLAKKVREMLVVD